MDARDLDMLGMNLAEVGTECISRQAAIDAIDKCAVWVMYTQGDSQKDESEFVENIIKQTKRAIQSMLREDLPSAQSEIIRCKDCKWFGKVGCAVEIVDDSDKPTEGDYCSFAERGE